jgi:hypothetical protein
MVNRSNGHEASWGEVSVSENILEMTKWHPGFSTNTISSREEVFPAL